jgi:Flp pilus assembly protein TadD
MSLVNQMLQDLEQRRTAEAGVSPLGGLNASGAASGVGRGINYILLGAALAFAFIAALAAAYMFGAEESASGPVTGTKVRVTTVPVREPLAQQQAAPASAAATPAVHPVTAQSPSRPQQALVVAPVTARSTLQTDNAPPVSASDGENHSQSTALVKTEVTLAEATKDTAKAARQTSETTPQGDTQASAATLMTAEDNSEADSAEASVVPVADKAFRIEKQIRPLTSAQQAQQAFQQAVQLLGRGDEGQARVALNQALSLQPAHVAARETLAALLLNTGHISEAATVLRTGLRITPTAAALAKLYARLLVDRGDTATAVTVLERALPAAVTDADYFALLAAFYQRLGRHAQAVQIYRRVLTARPGMASWWLGLAMSLEAMAEPSQALEAYERAQRSGGLQAKVLRYVQTRIVALTPFATDQRSPLVPAQDSDSAEDF